MFFREQLLQLPQVKTRNNIRETLGYVELHLEHRCLILPFFGKELTKVLIRNQKEKASRNLLAGRAGLRFKKGFTHPYHRATSYTKWHLYILRPLLKKEY